jgi:hypothetical protein
MLDNRFMDASGLAAAEKRFNECITTAEAVWGSNAFKRPGRDQALAGLFDAQMIALAELRSDDHRLLVQRRTSVHRQTSALFGDASFDEAVRRATNTPQRLRHRTEMMLSALRTAAQSK